MLGDKSTQICDLRHPSYAANSVNWEKYRLTYRGGTEFLNRYLKKFSTREDDPAFKDRKAVSYVPAFAKAAVNEIKNSIFQRLTDIIREGGSKAYHQAIEGVNGGVDKLGSSMTTFIGRDILPELLTMARVGIYVDMPQVAQGATLAEIGDGHRPYLYWYRAEDIHSYKPMDGPGDDPTEFKAILLKDTAYLHDDEWSLPCETSTRYRHVWVDDRDGFVHVRFYHKSVPQAAGISPVNEWETDGEEIVLKIRRIPFVLLELSSSVLTDVADYQIALMNLASADINYALKSNTPFYVEQYDWKSEASFFKQPTPGGAVATQQTGIENNSIIVSQEKTKEIRVGAVTGRRYPMNAERPSFIHPSSEPLQISMAKQEQLKNEIRQLVHLAVSTLSSTRRSAESMGLDNQGLEAGLSYIGLELQHAERKISTYWALYESPDAEPASVHYPTQYSLLSDEERRAAAAELKELLPMVPSLTFRREVSKRIVDVILGSKVKQDVLRAIKDEIDKDPVVIGDPAVIEQDVINGLVDRETASAARGYPKGVVEKAKTEHAERLALIAESQASVSGDMGARGVPDLGADPNAGKAEKRESQTDQTERYEVKPRTRGEGK